MSHQLVAKQAGISPSTVSRFFNGRPGVSERTAELLRQTVAALGAKLSTKVRASTRVKRKSIALIVFGACGVETPLERLLRGVCDASEIAECQLRIVIATDPSDLPPQIARGQIDGLLAIGAAPHSHLHEQLQTLPTVWLMGDPGQPRWGDQVMPDHRLMGEIAARYLLSRGHRSLAVIRSSGAVARLRTLGFSMTADEAAVAVQYIDLKEVRPLAESSDTTREKESDSGFMGIFIPDENFPLKTQAAIQLETQSRRNAEFVICDAFGLGPDTLLANGACIDIRAESIGRRAVEQLLWRFAHRDVSERVRRLIEPALAPPRVASASQASCSSSSNSRDKLCEVSCV